MQSSIQLALAGKGLKKDVLENNSIFFKVLKQKLYKEFQCSFLWYRPLLQYVTIQNFCWQAMWLWEFLVNTQIDENMYERLKILIER